MGWWMWGGELVDVQYGLAHYATYLRDCPLVGIRVSVARRPLNKRICIMGRARQFCCYLILAFLTYLGIRYTDLPQSIGKARGFPAWKASMAGWPVAGGSWAGWCLPSWQAGWPGWLAQLPG